MALTTTTLAAACAASDTSLVVTSATGFAAGSLIKVDDEFFQVANAYSSGTTIPVLRGQNGTAANAHVSGANCTVGVGSDWSNPNSTLVTAYPLSGKRFKVVSYTAAGAITLPVAGEDVFAIINGTTGVDMTVAAPPKDIDGSFLWVSTNGAATTNTVTFTGGLSGAGTSYDKITINTSAPVTLFAVAVNGLWQMPIGVAMAGTVTNLTGTVG